jgi:hypothetical protein
MEDRIVALPLLDPETAAAAAAAAADTATDTAAVKAAVTTADTAADTAALGVPVAVTSEVALLSEMAQAPSVSTLPEAILRTGCFFGVYDGHGGSEVSEHLEADLHLKVRESLRLRMSTTTTTTTKSAVSASASASDSADSTSTSTLMVAEEDSDEAWRGVEGALREAFVGLDKAVVIR